MLVQNFLCFFGSNTGFGSDTGLEVTVCHQAGACRDQLTDDDVLLQTDQMVDLALDCSIGQDLGGLLEGCGGQEGIGGLFVCGKYWVGERKRCLHPPKPGKTSRYIENSPKNLLTFSKNCI